jgi:hypothetical protein
VAHIKLPNLKSYFYNSKCKDNMGRPDDKYIQYHHPPSANFVKGEIHFAHDEQITQTNACQRSKVTLNPSQSNCHSCGSSNKIFHSHSICSWKINPEKQIKPLEKLPRKKRIGEPREPRRNLSENQRSAIWERVQ